MVEAGLGLDLWPGLAAVAGRTQSVAAVAVAAVAAGSPCPVAGTGYTLRGFAV